MNISKTISLLSIIITTTLLQCAQPKTNRQGKTNRQAKINREAEQRQAKNYMRGLREGTRPSRETREAAKTAFSNNQILAQNTIYNALYGEVQPKGKMLPPLNDSQMRSLVRELDINIVDDLGHTVLWDFAYNFDINRMNQLLEAGIDPLIEDHNGFTIIEYILYLINFNSGYEQILNVIQEHAERTNNQDVLSRIRNARAHDAGTDFMETMLSGM